MATDPKSATDCEGPVPGVCEEVPEEPSEQLPAIRQRVKHTPKYRESVGRQARKMVPRRSHGPWAPADGRPDPIDLLEEQAAQRDPDLVPIRYGRMLASPFAFYRGSALIMASDLAGTPTSGLRVQICGDAHLMNFGLFMSPQRRLVFDINDFDETLPGPWEWDLKRLAASFEVGGEDRGFPAATRRRLVLECARAYRESMLEMAAMRAMDVWYMHLDIDAISALSVELNKRMARALELKLSMAVDKDRLRALSRLTHMVDGKPRFLSKPPLLVPADELLQGEERDNYQRAVQAALQNYRSTLSNDHRIVYDLYRYREIARKVVGVGSVGTRAWVLLFVGRDNNDPMFLQSKQAQASVLERFVGKSQYQNAGRRVVEGQRLMQAFGDVLLGWYHVIGFDGKPYDFYVRQLWDGKSSFNVETMEEDAWRVYARACAQTLARAHARTGDRIAIAGYMGTSDRFDRAIADFAALYAEQNRRDYQALQAAVESGRITATTGI